MRQPSPERPVRSTGWSYRWIMLLVLIAGALAPAWAGGPVVVNSEGQPLHWDQSQTMRYTVDAGSLGARSHAWALAAIEKGFRAWQESPGSRLRIEPTREIATNITGRNVLGFLQSRGDNDPTAILLDSDGTIFDELFGEGASEAVLGYGGPFAADTVGGLVLSSLAILNGRLMGEFSDAYVESSIAHELGHCLNLAHSQVNAEALYDGDPSNDADTPAMFYRGPNDKGGLHADDRAWFAWLHPSGGSTGLGSIQGRVLLPDGVTGMRGVQVIARRVDDPRKMAVGTVSGFLFRSGEEGDPNPERLGEFVIPNLPPGSYTLELQQLGGFPGVPVRAGFLFSGSKFWRDGSSAQDSPSASTPIVVNADQRVTGINIVVNGESLGEPKLIQEQEPNSLPVPQPITLPAIISGGVQGQDGIDAGDGHDLYRFTLREWTIITATLTAAQRQANLDLSVLYLDNQSHTVFDESTGPGTPPETVQLRLPPGRYSLGVHRVGIRGSDYTLKVLATPSPAAESEAAAVWISYLVIGDVTTTGAMMRWQATGETTAVAYYNKPVREVGSALRAREQKLSLSEMPASTESDVEIYAASPGGMDLTLAAFKTATAPSASGTPRLEIEQASYFVDLDLWEVEIRIANLGSGDARDVRIETVTPSRGWEVLSSLYSGTPFPATVEVGGIGAGGAGMVLIRLIRLRGEEFPELVIRGSYTDSLGRLRTF